MRERPLCSPPLLRIDVRSIPAVHISSGSLLRHGAHEKPAIAAVAPAHAPLALQFLPSGETALPCLAKAFLIVRMEDAGELLAGKLLGRPAGVVHQVLVAVDH